MKRLLIAFLVLSFTGCAIRDAYPIAGAVAGAGGGAAIGGVPGAVIGSGVGYGAGKLGQLADKNKELVKAITEKDVQAMLEAGMGRQRGFIDSAIDAIWGTLKLALWAILLYNLIPILYTRYILRKAINGKGKKAA
jgi:hypothetical protein